MDAKYKNSREYKILQMDSRSNSDSEDSDEGIRIRYKTETTRNKHSIEDTNQAKNENLNACIGPALPPHLRKSRIEENKSEDNNTPDCYIGPSIPSRLSSDLEQNKTENLIKSTIGPALPEHLSNKCEESKNETVVIGPTLPPHLTQKTNSEISIIGPCLPPHLLKSQTLNQSSETKTEITNDDNSLPNIVGPTLPPHLREKLLQNAKESSNHRESDEEDDGIYGPVPIGSDMRSEAQVALEERALQMKIDGLTPKSNAPEREEWMIELPDVKLPGLGARQFRAKAGPDMSDRTSWTDIANKKKQKEAKVDLKQEAVKIEAQKRDQEQEKLSKKHKKRNSESLVEIHQKKMKNSKESTSTERRPFNRETDLQVNKFDDAQKKAALKKAELLDDRFSRGQTKYL